jgi:hypothetical protein
MYMYNNSVYPIDDSMMTKTENVSERLDCCSEFTWLLAHMIFITFSHHESFKSREKTFITNLLLHVDPKRF